MTAGGRVMMCVARAADIRAAREEAYALVGSVGCDNLFYRGDIAWQALK